MLTISHGRAVDEMDVPETSGSRECSRPPIQCALGAEPPPGRRVSIGAGAAAAPDAGDPASGARRDLFDDYDVLPTVLGTGAYGRVRECLRRRTGEVHAVKTIDTARATRRDHVRREIRLLGSLDHPGIVKIVDCYEDEAYVHIVAERCTGGELFDKIIDNTSDSGCLPEGRTVEIITSILRAVQYLHGRNVVHRDIKPENVLFESAEEGAPVKLIDFGLSRSHGARDGPMRARVGTAYYMSPAVLRGEYDRACDIWAVGVLAYILLCGYPPFNGSNDHEVHVSVLEGNLAFEKDPWGHLSKASRDFVSRILGEGSSKNITSVEEALRHPWIAGC